MHKHLALVVAASLVFAASAVAREPAAPKPTPKKGAVGTAARPPRTGRNEFYARQVRRDDDRGMSVRRKAEFRTQQRMRRMAAMKWFGMSNSRPIASATPWSSRYSPGWVSNTRRPFSWSGVGGTIVLNRVDVWQRR